jgi:hypothetical protein
MANANLPVTGGCLCGAVRYVSVTPPSEGFYCHCRTCQRFFGGLSGAFVRIARASLVFTKGAPSYYRSSDVATRGFCVTCGSPMVFVYDAPAADYWIGIGSLDRPEDWPLTRSASWGPVAQGHVDRKIPWQEIDDGLPQRTSEKAVYRQQAEAALSSKEPR